MIGERYTLILRHEIYDQETKQTISLDPPLSVCHTMLNPYSDRACVTYCVNDLLRKMEDAFLKRLDGVGQEGRP